MRKIEKPSKGIPSTNKMNIEYKKLKLCSILLGIIAAVSIIISIVK